MHFLLPEPAVNGCTAPARGGQVPGRARQARSPAAGGRFVFDVFTPDDKDIEQTHDRWLEREPGIFEHAVWDEGARTLTLSVRGREGETTMALAWLSPEEWRALLEETGFEIQACYG